MSIVEDLGKRLRIELPYSGHGRCVTQEEFEAVLAATPPNYRLCSQKLIDQGIDNLLFYGHFIYAGEPHA